MTAREIEVAGTEQGRAGCQVELAVEAGIQAAAREMVVAEAGHPAAERETAEAGQMAADWEVAEPGDCRTIPA